MRADTYMRKYHMCRLRIQRYREQIAELKDMSQRITPVWSSDKVQSTPHPDKMGALVARMADIEASLISEIRDALDAMNEIEGVIDRIGEVELQAVLHKRYIAMKTYERIAEEMYYSPRWVWELNQRALKEVERIINNDMDV